MSYTGSLIDSSPTRAFTTADSLAGGAFTAVALTENGVVTAGASSIPIGIITAEYDLPVQAGEDITAQVTGGSLLLVSEAVKAGDQITVDAGGIGKKATSGKYVFAMALANGAASSAVPVQIIHGGKA